MFDYTEIADRLSIVNWSNYINPTGVINQAILSSLHESRVIKRTRINIYK